MDLLQIDGMYGEGGGQIIRTTLSLAALTGRAVEIVNMRAGRPKPGLQPQHLAAVRAAAALCDAELSGAAVGSVRLQFRPQSPVRPGDYRLEIGTAGATPLVVQTALLPLALSGGPARLCVTGGTHVPFAPTVEYLEAVYLPLLASMGVSAQISYPRAGFYPRGGGEVQVEIAAAGRVMPLTLAARGALQELRAYIVTADLPEHVGARGAATVAQFMQGLGLPVAIESRVRSSNGPGAAVVITARCAGGAGGFSALGARGKPMERVAEEACSAFLAWWESGAACDAHLGDQLVLPAALAAGESRWTVPEVTEHLRTVLWVVQHFVPVEAAITGDGPYQVTLRGCSVSA